MRFLLFALFATVILAQPPNNSGGSSGTACATDGSGSTYTETLANDIRTITANGCPNHQAMCTGKSGITGCGATGENGSATEAKEQEKSLTIPAKPVLRTDTKSVECTLGSIAIALNGVSIFSGAVDTACTPVELDSCTSEWVSFDCCGGHAEQTGDYHYHFPPSCLLDQAGTVGSNGHSAQIGWAYDGFPIYGPLSVGGVTVKNCGASGADATYCQDECGGIAFENSDVDDFKYRYYMTGYQGDLLTLPFYPRPAIDGSQFPFTINCYKGLLQEEIESGATGTAGYTDAYTPTAHAGFTNAHSTTCEDVTYECTDGVTSNTASGTATTTTTTEATDATTTTDATDATTTTDGSSASMLFAMLPFATLFALL